MLRVFPGYQSKAFHKKGSCNGNKIPPFAVLGCYFQGKFPAPRSIAPGGNSFPVGKDSLGGSDKRRNGGANYVAAPFSRPSMAVDIAAS
jgi:hypothetical protein